MTKEMNMMIMRFIERNMEENMFMAVTMYGYRDYANGHTYIERLCAYGHTRKILLNGGTKEDIQKLADEYCGKGKSHIWFAYNNVAKEIDSIEQFIKCGLYKTNTECEAENQQWISVDERLPEKEGYYLVTSRTFEEDFETNLCEYGYNINDIWKGSSRLMKDGSAFGEMWHGEIDNVQETIAWMPLPKPAKFE